MTVYVGPCMWKFRRWLLGHMFCDPGTTDSLHTMAEQIGLQRSWFQDKPNHPHYDITDLFRRRAIARGAIPLNDLHQEAAIHERHAAMRTARIRGRGGTVRDIRTGRAIGRTDSLSHTFISQVEGLIEDDEQFYVVYGRCRHQEVRILVNDLKTLEDVQVIYDKQMPSDTIWLFEGEPEELGFAS